MIGVGVGSGGISFVNALPTGVGAAAGVSLWTTATVDIVAARAPSLEVDGRSDSPLVVETMRSAIERWSPGMAARARVRVDSAVPVAVGLKSSSAVGAAVARAIASALGVTPSAEEIAGLAADAAQRIGLSATGAFDDALAAVVPGIHVTDNPARTRLRTDPADPRWNVVLWVPPGRHRPSTEVREAFRAVEADGRAAADAARAGRPLEAMARNTEVVERVMGYPYAALRAAVAEAGAVASGVSGMGPAVAVLVPADRIGPVRNALGGFPGAVTTTRFTQPGAGGVGGSA